MPAIEDEKVIVKPGSAFATLDATQLGVVLALFHGSDNETYALVRMQNGKLLEAKAQTVAAGAMLARRFEVKL